MAGSYFALVPAQRWSALLVWNWLRVRLERRLAAVERRARRGVDRVPTGLAGHGRSTRRRGAALIGADSWPRRSSGRSTASRLAAGWGRGGCLLAGGGGGEPEGVREPSDASGTVAARPRALRQLRGVGTELPVLISHGRTATADPCKARRDCVRTRPQRPDGRAQQSPLRVTQQARARDSASRRPH